MKKILDIYLDSDVIVSSCLSSTGAAYFLLNQDHLVKFYTDLQEKELKVVFERLNITLSKLFQALKKCTLIPLKSPQLDLYSKYTSDPNDRHIIAGAVASRTRFLVSYNLKHFQIEAIKRDFDITVLTPAHFLQFLRSLKQF